MHLSTFKCHLISQRSYKRHSKEENAKMNICNTRALPPHSLCLHFCIAWRFWFKNKPTKYSCWGTIYTVVESSSVSQNTSLCSLISTKPSEIGKKHKILTHKKETLLKWWEHLTQIANENFSRLHTIKLFQYALHMLTWTVNLLLISDILRMPY